MPIPNPVVLPHRLEPVERVLAERPQKPEARLPRRDERLPNEALADERLHYLEDVGGRILVEETHMLGFDQAEAPGEDR